MIQVIHERIAHQKHFGKHFVLHRWSTWCSGKYLFRRRFLVFWDDFPVKHAQFLKLLVIRVDAESDNLHQNARHCFTSKHRKNSSFQCSFLHLSNEIDQSCNRIESASHRNNWMNKRYANMIIFRTCAATIRSPLTTKDNEYARVNSRCHHWTPDPLQSQLQMGVLQLSHHWPMWRYNRIHWRSLGPAWSMHN